MFSPVSYNWNHLLQMLIFSYSVYSCSSYSENWQIECSTSKNILKSKLKFKICSDATCNKNSFSQHTFSSAKHIPFGATMTLRYDLCAGGTLVYACSAQPRRSSNFLHKGLRDMSNSAANAYWEETDICISESVEVVDFQKPSLFRSVLSTFGSCVKNIHPQQK